MDKLVTAALVSDAGVVVMFPVPPVEDPGGAWVWQDIVAINRTEWRHVDDLRVAIHHGIVQVAAYRVALDTSDVYLITVWSIIARSVISKIAMKVIGVEKCLAIDLSLTSCAEEEVRVIAVNVVLYLQPLRSRGELLGDGRF